VEKPDGTVEVPTRITVSVPVAERRESGEWRRYTERRLDAQGRVLASRVIDTNLGHSAYADLSGGVLRSATRIGTVGSPDIVGSDLSGTTTLAAGWIDEEWIWYRSVQARYWGGQADLAAR
jgi:hypothetical protein